MHCNRLNLCHSSPKPKTLLVWRIARFLIFPQWVSKMVSLDSPQFPPLDLSHDMSEKSTEIALLIPPFPAFSPPSSPPSLSLFAVLRKSQPGTGDKEKSIWVQDSQKRKLPVTRDNFSSLSWMRKEIAQLWFRDLVGNKPLSQLLKKVSTASLSVDLSQLAHVWLGTTPAEP